MHWPYFLLGQSLGNRTVSLPPKPLHKAGAPEEDAHLHRLPGFLPSCLCNSTGSNDFLFPAGTIAGALRVWFHPLALHQDDLPRCPRFVPPCQVNLHRSRQWWSTEIFHYCHFVESINWNWVLLVSDNFATYVFLYKRHLVLPKLLEKKYLASLDPLRF